MSSGTPPRDASHGLSLTDDLPVRIARTALASWQEFEHAQLTLIKVRENAVFQVTGPSRERYALRIHRLHYHSDLSLASEYRWMAALAESGVFTPTRVQPRSGEEFARIGIDGHHYQVDAFKWIDGSSAAFPPGGGDAPLEHILRTYRMMGEAMQLAHAHSRRWTPAVPFERHAWDLDGLAGESPLWGRFWEYPFLTATERTQLTHCRDALRDRLKTMGNDPTRFGLIHADLMPDNIIVSGNRLYVIDFDDAGYGWYLYDVAVSLFSFTTHPEFSAVLAAFLKGYRPGGGLNAQESQHLTMFLAARGATLVGWLHSRDPLGLHPRAGWVISLACKAAQRWLDADSCEGAHPS